MRYCPHALPRNSRRPDHLPPLRRVQHLLADGAAEEAALEVDGIDYEQQRQLVDLLNDLRNIAVRLIRLCR